MKAKLIRDYNDNNLIVSMAKVESTTPTTASWNKII